MHSKLFNKGLIVGIIILFIGASVFPATSIKDFNEKLIEKQLNEESELQSDSSQDIDWWSMFQHDVKHSGYSTSIAPEINNMKWSYITENWVDSSPAVFDGKVYVGSDDSKVYCLDADNGIEIWSCTTGNSIRSSPAVFDGKVYVGSWDSRVYCLDADNGTKIWTYKTGIWVQSSPAVFDGKVYVGSLDNKVYCLDANIGTEIWSFTTGNWVQSSPAVFDGKVYVGSRDNKVYCLDADNGTEIWSFTTGNWVFSSPTIFDGKVYIGSDDSKVYCLNADIGTEIWNYTTGDNVRSSPANADGKIYFGSWDNKVYCLDANNGTVIWSFTTGDNVESSPAIADGKVYIGSWDNKMYCLDADIGTEIWSYITGDNVESSPAVADGKVYIGSWDNKLYCFEVENYPPFPPIIYEENGSLFMYSIDRDGDGIFYLIDWGDGYIDDWFGPYPSGEMIEINHEWSEPGEYVIRAKARDIYGAESNWSDPFIIIIGKYPPSTPIITGPSSGIPGSDLYFTLNSVDPDGDDVRYFIDWGDTCNDTTFFAPSGANVTISHMWNDIGEYSIIARAEDEYGALSGWSEPYPIIIKKSKSINFPFQWLKNFQQFHLFLFPIIRQLLKL